jgi:uncharacterized coiled-coil protein SlyX
VELEQRLSRLEGCCTELTADIAIAKKRLAALQAELDHLAARTGRN